MLLVTGDTYDYDLNVMYNSEQAEVLKLVAKESKVLPSKFSYPEKVEGATGGVINGIPFIIGGYSRNTRTESYECRKLTSEGWQTFAQLTKRRSGAASVVLQDNQIWVTGGKNKPSNGWQKAYILTSTEIIDMKTKESTTGPALPTKLAGHAMAKLNENKTLIIGGYGSQGGEAYKKCWIYDQYSFEFTPGPEMIDARAWFGWGIFSSSLHDGRQCLLVAGGKSGNDLSSGEILDFTQTNATWNKSNGLSIYSLFI